jgi:hypothetical protein
MILPLLFTLNNYFEFSRFTPFVERRTPRRSPLASTRSHHGYANSPLTLCRKAANHWATIVQAVRQFEALRQVEADAPSRSRRAIVR